MSEKENTQPTEQAGPFTGILGRKLGITQLYDDEGVLHAVTVVKAGPCVVVQRKSTDRDGYSALQIGFMEGERGVKKLKKPMAGHFTKAGVEPVRFLKEIRLRSDEERPDLEPGKQVTVGELSAGDLVDVVATSKGKGFQGVMRRHGFGGGRATHGSMFHRAPGSIGASAFPSRVFKGTRLPGHMGSRRVTVKNLSVLRVEPENDLLFLAGSVPGARNAYLQVRPAKAGGRKKKAS